MTFGSITIRSQQLLIRHRSLQPTSQRETPAHTVAAPSSGSILPRPLAVTRGLRIWVCTFGTGGRARHPAAPGRPALLQSPTTATTHHLSARHSPVGSCTHEDHRRHRHPLQVPCRRPSATPTGTGTPPARATARGHPTMLTISTDEGLRATTSASPNAERHPDRRQDRYWSARTRSTASTSGTSSRSASA